MALTMVDTSGGVKLSVSICSNRAMPAHAAMSFSALLYHLGKANVKFAVMGRTNASLLSTARQELLWDAQRDGCTHQLWIDDDMQYPADVAQRLLAHDVDVVGVNACRKAPQLQYTAVGLDGKIMESMGKTGLEEVSHVGLGVTLVRLSALKSLPAPHFEVLWDEQAQRYRGEDRFFMDKLRAAGVKIHVDHGLSHHIVHWGDMGYEYGIYAGDRK